MCFEVNSKFKNPMEIFWSFGYCCWRPDTLRDGYNLIWFVDWFFFTLSILYTYYIFCLFNFIIRLMPVFVHCMIYMCLQDEYMYFLGEKCDRSWTVLFAERTRKKLCGTNCELCTVLCDRENSQIVYNVHVVQYTQTRVFTVFHLFLSFSCFFFKRLHK